MFTSGHYIADSEVRGISPLKEVHESYGMRLIFNIYVAGGGTITVNTNLIVDDNRELLEFQLAYVAAYREVLELTSKYNTIKHVEPPNLARLIASCTRRLDELNRAESATAGG